MPIINISPLSYRERSIYSAKHFQRALCVWKEKRASSAFALFWKSCKLQGLQQQPPTVRPDLTALFHRKLMCLPRNDKTSLTREAARLRSSFARETGPGGFPCCCCVSWLHTAIPCGGPLSCNMCLPGERSLLVSFPMPHSTASDGFPGYAYTKRSAKMDHDM
jgi:hypothetical protein